MYSTVSVFFEIGQRSLEISDTRAEHPLPNLWKATGSAVMEDSLSPRIDRNLAERRATKLRYIIRSPILAPVHGLGAAGFRLEPHGSKKLPVKSK